MPPPYTALHIVPLLLLVLPGQYVYHCRHRAYPLIHVKHTVSERPLEHPFLGALRIRRTSLQFEYHIQTEQHTVKQPRPGPMAACRPCLKQCRGVCNTTTQTRHNLTAHVQPRVTVT
eukprot:XP_001696010.1 predicted protein [Chlamydomonas reinhardtii]